MNTETNTKRCRYCQTEIPKSAKICPNCRKKQGGKLKWVILAVVITGIGIAAGSSSNDGNNNSVQKVATISDTTGNQDAGRNSSTADPTDNSRASGHEAENNEPDKTARNGSGKNGNKKSTDKKESGNINHDHTFAAGDVIETPELRISYLSAGEYISDNQFIQPEKGYVYYQIEFEFENISDSDQFVSSYNFECYADGYDMEQSYINDAMELDANLSPGRKTKGAVIFEVPQDSKEILLEYETNLWTDERIVFKVK